MCIVYSRSWDLCKWKGGRVLLRRHQQQTNFPLKLATTSYQLTWKLWGGQLPSQREGKIFENLAMWESDQTQFLWGPGSPFSVGSAPYPSQALSTRPTPLPTNVWKSWIRTARSESLHQIGNIYKLFRGYIPDGYIAKNTGQYSHVLYIWLDCQLFMAI